MKSVTPRNGDADFTNPSSTSHGEVNENNTSTFSSRRTQLIVGSSVSIWRKGYIWLVLALAVVGVGIAIWFSLSDTPKADTVTPSTTLDASTGDTGDATAFQMPSKEERAQVQLVDPIEANKKMNLYEISNAQQVKLSLVAKKSTMVEVREVDSKGKTLSTKTLKNGDKLDFTHQQGLYIKLNEPMAALLSVNGVTMDTSTEEDEGIYQFRLVKGE